MAWINAIPNWAFWCASGVFVLLALWCLWRARLFDRSRGRRRCPKCWYDMAGVAGLKCPECGSEAKSERSLFRSSRSWSLLALSGALFAAASLPLWVENPLRLVPTGLLLWLKPRWYAESAGRNASSGSTPSNWIVAELDARFERDDLLPDQVLRSFKASNVLRARKKWPASMPYMIGLNPECDRTELLWLIPQNLPEMSELSGYRVGKSAYFDVTGDSRDVPLIQAGLLPPGTAELTCDLAYRGHGFPGTKTMIGSWVFPIELANSIDDVIPLTDGVSTPLGEIEVSFDSEKQATSVYPTPLQIQFTTNASDIDQRIGFGFQATLWRDGKELDRCSVILLRRSGSSRPVRYEGTINFNGMWKSAVGVSEIKNWEVRVVPDQWALLTQWDVEFAANLSGTWAVSVDPPKIERK